MFDIRIRQAGTTMKGSRLFPVRAREWRCGALHYVEIYGATLWRLRGVV
jgi:hypothetical protein